MQVRAALPAAGLFGAKHAPCGPEMGLPMEPVLQLFRDWTTPSGHSINSLESAPRSGEIRVRRQERSGAHGSSVRLRLAPFQYRSLACCPCEDRVRRRLHGSEP